MIRVPTCDIVQVRGVRRETSPVTGNFYDVELFSISFDYLKLAPLSMPGVDPMEALVHFEHQINIGRQGALIPVSDSRSA